MVKVKGQGIQTFGPSLTLSQAPVVEGGKSMMVHGVLDEVGVKFLPKFVKIIINYWPYLKLAPTFAALIPARGSMIREVPEIWMEDGQGQMS